MLDQTSFNALRLADAHLTQIEWVEGGRDLAITLISASGNTTTLLCNWVHARHIDLRTPTQRGGLPLTWSAALEQADSGWRLILDFAEEGRINLLCSGVSIELRAGRR